MEDLQELAELSLVPYSSSQIMNLGFIIMSSHRMLCSDVRKWIRNPAVEKTWANFKTHFTQAHIKLRETATLADELGFHGANALVENIIDRLRTEGVIDNPPEQQEPAPVDIHVPPRPPAPEQGSEATRDPAALTTYMIQITAQIANLQAQLTAAVAEQHQTPW